MLKQSDAQANRVFSMPPASRDRSQSQPLRLDFVRTLTDDTGMMQHAVGGVPDPHTGYTTDDNARAFLAMVRLWRKYPGRRTEVDPLLRRYLQFLLWAQRRENAPAENGGGSGDGVNGDGWFRNFASYHRHFLEDRGSEDCLGRCVWALGEAESGELPQGTRLAVRQMLGRSRAVCESIHAPHAICYQLLGLSGLASDAGIRPLVQRGLDRLMALWQAHSEPGWHWFEPHITYDSPRYCEAIMRAGVALGCDEAIAIGRQSLDFLTEHSFDPERGYLIPVGCRTWWKKGCERDCFDQQTVEAGAYIEAYRYAASLFNESAYTAHAERTREWFWGHNVHRLPLYDPDSGGCYDALTVDGVNLNQGAESVLSYLLAESCGAR